MKKLIPFLLLLSVGCTKIDIQPINPAKVLDLGNNPMSTSINKVTQNENILSVEFNVTPGAKYSVQFVPFNSDEPVKIEGFTASTGIVTKIYDLSSFKKMDYNLIFIDVLGNQVKMPIIVN
jgi:hypothetical protein